jgi:hypothetical protein
MKCRFTAGNYNLTPFSRLANAMLNKAVDLSQIHVFVRGGLLHTARTVTLITPDVTGRRDL